MAFSFARRAAYRLTIAIRFLLFSTELFFAMGGAFWLPRLSQLGAGTDIRKRMSVELTAGTGN